MEEILKEYNINIVKQDNIAYFKAKDIGNLLEIKKISKTLLNFTNLDKKIIKTQTNGGLQNVIYVTERGVKRIICTTRKPKSIMLAKELRIDVYESKNMVLEVSFIINIKKIFLGVEILEQHKVDKFSVDLYIPKYNLCIEYDENYHIFNLEKDKKRQKYIEEKLKCKFLRMNEKDNIFDFINKVLHYIKFY